MGILLIRFITIPGLILFGSIAAARHCESNNVMYGENSDRFAVAVYNDVTAAAAKSLIILPPTGGINLIDRSYASRFCRKGFDVYIINDWPQPGEGTIDLELHQHFYGNAQKAIGIVTDKITSPFIGILGTSVGALHASVSANTIDRLNAVFLIVGGLPIAEVVVNSDQQAMRDLRAARQKKFGFISGEENIQGIRKVFNLEPTSLGSLYRKKLFGAVIATQDSTVPYANQIKLQEFFRPQKSIVMNNGHFWAILKTWLFHSNEVVEFFDRAAETTAARKR